MANLNTKMSLPPSPRCPTSVFHVLVFLFILSIHVVLVLGDIEVPIDEEVPPGHEVTRLADHRDVYKTLDPSQIPLMSHAILDQNNAPANYFTIDQSTGEVTIAKRMDRETICDPGAEVCNVQINIAIQSGPQASVTFSNVVTVVVTINDVNDNAPTFPAKDVTLDVSEGAKVGTELKISGAVDRDSKPQFTVQHYNTTPSLDVFSIRPTTNPDGSSTINLRLEKELDREKTDAYVFNIIAYDGGSDPQSDYLRVTVKVTDDNDNSPVFDNLKYELSINEDEKSGAVVGRVTATDKDIGDFGRITYSFSQASESSIKGIFAINSSTGVITLQGELNTMRRSSSPFFMYVDAKDGGDPPRSSQTLLSVFIINSGNNAPFVRVNTITAGDASTLTIPESAKSDFFVAFVDVEDNDEGDNGKVSCQLLSGSDFKLSSVPNKGYTLLLNREVDRETKDSYQIVISCKDGADPPLETTVSLTVNVTDINDNTPKFKKSPYTASVYENRDPGQYVTQVTAEDDDVGMNAVITYSLPREATKYFKVQSRTGVISTNAPLDREKNATLRFIVFASDGGSESKTGTTEIFVTVKDVNDNKPEFNRTKFSFFVSEKTENNTIIGSLTAHDYDTNANGQFDFYFGGSTNGDMPLPVTVLKNGSLQVSGLLDRETKAHYSFNALVRDRGDIPLSSMVPVEIKILDENDNEPVILFPTSRNHTIVISTFPENGMVLGRIIAYDMDEGDAADLRYHIYEGNEDNAFSIELTTGELLLQNMKRLQNPQDYYLSIKVEDASPFPRNATTQLRIEVNFENMTAANLHVEPEGSRDQYVIIVGVIGGATIVLSVIIISAIIIILRSEKSRRNGGSGSFFKNKFFSGTAQSVPNQKTVDSPDVTKSQSTSSLGSDPNGLILSPGNLGKKSDEGPKKVSFSLNVQDDLHNQSHGHLPDKQLRLNLPVDQSARWKNFNNPDDLNSDTSGESGTCDSGRGTSDEDIKFDHSPNRGPLRHAPGDPYVSSRDRSFDQFMPPNPVNIRAVPNIQGQGTSRLHTPTPPPLKSGQPRFLEMGGGRHEGGKARSSYHGHRQPSHSSSGASSSLRQPNHQRGLPAYKDISNLNPDLLRPPSAMSHAQQGSAVSMDDDASTTTSGSYVINPDDVRLEGLLGKDIIV